MASCARGGCASARRQRTAWTAQVARLAGLRQRPVGLKQRLVAGLTRPVARSDARAALPQRCLAFLERHVAFPMWRAASPPSHAGLCRWHAAPMASCTRLRTWMPRADQCGVLSTWLGARAPTAGCWHTLGEGRSSGTRRTAGGGDAPPRESGTPHGKRCVPPSMKSTNTSVPERGVNTAPSRGRPGFAARAPRCLCGHRPGRWLNQHPTSAGTSGKSLSSLTGFALFFIFLLGEEAGAYSGVGSHG